MTSMYVIEVIPFSKAAPAGTLSYRSREKLPRGALVTVPLRKQTVPALVISVASVLESKATLKRASYTLRASEVSKIGTVPPPLMRATEDVARYHATTLGSVWSALWGDALPTELPKVWGVGTGFKAQMLESPFERRLARYRERIEKRSGAVLLVAPTLSEVKLLAARLSEFDPLVLTGALTGAKRSAALTAAVAAKGLIIATPAFSYTPIRHLDTIIVERPSAGTYKQVKRPYLDMLIALRALAEARECSLVIGDYPLPLEYRTVSTAALTAEPEGIARIIDAKEIDKEREVTGGTWRVLPEPVIAVMEKTLATGGRVGVLAARRGYAPGVVCRDCGTLVKDAAGRPLSLSIGLGKRVYRTADGTSLRSTETKCDHCDSWNLLPLGVGIERVAEELKKAFPTAPLVLFDSDRVKTPAQAIKKITEAGPGSILLGTEVMLSSLSTRDEDLFDLGIVASTDSLLSLPFWRARERILRLGLMLRERARKTLVVSRRTDDEAVQAIAHPLSPVFFEHETMLRKAVAYPPFGTLLVFHAEGSPARLERAKAEVAAAIERSSIRIPLTLLADRPVTAERSRSSQILHLPGDAWPDAELVREVELLSPAIQVLINPETLW